MAWSDPTERLTALREWFQLLIDDPPAGLARRERLLQVAGELFDEGNLEGRQYAAIFDLVRSLRSPEAPEVRELAQCCLDLIR
jgi:hypothetical protein